MNKDPLSWYIAGPLIGLIIPLLLILREKQFGMSSSFRFILSKLTKKPSYFNYNSKLDLPQIHFAIGLICVGIFYFFNFGVDFFDNKKLSLEFPVDFYNLSNYPVFILGGYLIGFGSRYANGCTAGHCIMGISQLSLGSLIATIGFFIGGLIAAHFLNPLIFNF